MGYGLIQTGLRESDDALIHAGMRAVTYATDPGRIFPPPSVFETMAVASAYDLAKQRLSGDRVFAAARAQWEAWLERAKTVRPTFINRYGNHRLVGPLSVPRPPPPRLHSHRPRPVLRTRAHTPRAA